MVDGIEADGAGWQTIAPTVPLNKELESLMEFLVHQKPALASGDREFNGADSGVCVLVIAAADEGADYCRADSDE
ncbi:unnamed protein product [Phytophthora fragariaefolia]|uniref:Unnamed protein product n=1 Tax=Phytophthora fragariaefolia TaxID=1490495 RepID=A0A9W6XVM1_9STRA|nr:unnamed protein product [Phytophthora fragariaefolia]